MSKHLPIPEVHTYVGSVFPHSPANPRKKRTYAQEAQRQFKEQSAIDKMPGPTKARARRQARLDKSMGIPPGINTNEPPAGTIVAKRKRK